jgi:hypothetical protein
VFERIVELVAGMNPESRWSVPALSNWEFVRRVRQLEYLFQKATSSAITAATLTTEDMSRHEATSEVAVTYAEAFYLFAWRVRTCLTQGNPLGPFNPEGVNRVRNLLIEHPEHGGPPLPTWVLSGDGDVRLTLGGEWADYPSTSRRGPYRDPGLLANATEFKTRLEELLEAHRDGW